MRLHKTLSLALLSTALFPVAAVAQQTASDQGSAVETVVVTAQKRAEKNQNVPISITALSADDLRKSGVGSTMDLGKVTPGLRIDQTGTFVQPTIRGVGSGVTGIGLASNVATYVDGFYVPSELGDAFDLASVQSIQVLKGPQGTLFGRNATGGAILVNTLDPSFEPSAKLIASLGNYGTSKFEAYATTGLTDTLAGNIDFYAKRSDGYIKNITTGQNEQRNYDITVRGKLLWQPTESMSFNLTYEHTHMSDPTAAIYVAYQGSSIGNVVPGAVVNSQFGKSVADPLAQNTIVEDAVYLKSTFDFDWATLKSYTGYRDERARENSDLDGSSAHLFDAYWHENEKTFTQEFDLSSNGDGPLNWVAGAFYMNDKGDIPFFNFEVCTGFPACTFNYQTQKAKTTSWAVFADATYEILEDLYLTAGVRYSSDKLESTQEPFGIAALSSTTSHTWNSLTPRGVLRYQVDPSTSIYASVSQGFKAGAFNAGSDPVTGKGVLTPVSPEKITAYEVGYKTAQHRWSLDLAAFYYDYTNLQFTSYVFTAANPVSVLQNAATARIYGAEAQFNAAVTNELTAGLGLAYTHARYGDFPGAVGSCPHVLGAAAGVCAPVTAGSVLLGNYTFPASANGKTMARAPDFTANVSLDYLHPISFGAVELHANYYYSTRVYFEPTDEFSQPAFGVLDLRASWLSPDDVWQVSVYGTNVTDERYFNHISPSSFATLARYAAPAMYGVEVRVNLD